MCEPCVIHPTHLMGWVDVGFRGGICVLCLNCTIAPNTIGRTALLRPCVASVSIKEEQDAEADH